MFIRLLSADVAHVPPHSSARDTNAPRWIKNIYFIRSWILAMAARAHSSSKLPPGAPLTPIAPIAVHDGHPTDGISNIWQRLRLDIGKLQGVLHSASPAAAPQARRAITRGQAANFRRRSER